MVFFSFLICTDVRKTFIVASIILSIIRFKKQLKVSFVAAIIFKYSLKSVLFKN